MKSRHLIKRLSDRQHKSFRKNAENSRVRVFISHNFSDVEDDSKTFEMIRNLAAHAGNNEAAEANARGLSRVYIRNHKYLVKVAANGDEVHIDPRIKREFFYIKYAPHTVLYAVTK